MLYIICDIYIYIYIYLFIYLSIYLFIYMCVCLYVYIFIHIRLYIHNIYQCDKPNNKPSPKSPQMCCHNHENASCLWHGANPTSLMQNIQTRFDLVTFHRRQCFSFCWIDGIMTAFETAGMRFLQLTSRELSWSLWIFSTVHGCQKTSYSTRKKSTFVLLVKTWKEFPETKLS